jgi:hypothetical protein
MIVITAVMIQAAIKSAGESTNREISAETINMPDPIMDPITMQVAPYSPSPWTNCPGAAAGVVAAESDPAELVFMIPPPLVVERPMVAEASTSQCPNQIRIRAGVDLGPDEHRAHVICGLM